MSHLIIATVLYIAIVAIAYRPKSVNVSVSINYFPEVEPEITTEENILSELSEPIIAHESSSVILSPWDSTNIVESVVTMAIATETAQPDLHLLSIRELKKLASKAKIKRYSTLNKCQLIEALAA